MKFGADGDAMRFKRFAVFSFNVWIKTRGFLRRTLMKKYLMFGLEEERSGPVHPRGN